MGPEAIALLAAHGLPAWLLPGYWALAGLSALLGGAIALGLAERDGAVVHAQARAMLAALVGALAGGPLVELLRVTPAAVADWSLDPYLHVGRAAWGGLLGSIAGASIALRAQGQPVGAFFDRAVPAAGISFALVRAGCFLSGCDYGVPTSSRLGVRFPAESLAAMDHAARGWIEAGARSLPVHPTQLYEGVVGLGASAIAWALLGRGPRDGRAFLAWIALYSAGRFAVELLRGDATRGLYAGISTGQWTAVVAGTVALVLLGELRRAPRPASTTL